MNILQKVILIIGAFFFIIQILSIFNVHNELINEFTLGSSREVIPASPSVVPPILLGILRVSSVLVGVTLLLFLTRTRGKK